MSRRGPSVKRGAPSSAILASTLLVGMAMGSAWAFGGTSAAAQWALQILASICSICALVTLMCAGGDARPLPLAILPLGGGLLLGAAQLVPLPLELHELLSPTENAWRSELSFPATAGQGEVPDQPLSLYPAATRNRMSLLLLGTLCFGAMGLVQSRATTVFMLFVMTVGGAALAFFGLAQKLAWEGKLFWRFEIPAGAGPFASFVNKNNAAGFLLVCIAAAVGCIVWITHRHLGVLHAEARRRRQSGPHEGFGKRVIASLARLDAAALVVWGSLALMMTGLLASMSRGGLIAFAGASLVTLLTALASRGRKSILAALVPAMLISACMLSLLGLNEAVASRTKTLFNREIISQARIPHWKDGVKAVPDFWTVGSGLGTYRFVYPPYQQRLDDAWYLHAENQFLETAVEAGVPGLALLGLMILLVGRAAWYLVRRALTPEGYALGYAGVFGLTSQVIHAIADFATFIPAVTVLFAVLCGMVCSEAAATAAVSHRRGRLLTLTGSRMASAAYLSSLLVLCVFGIAETGCAAMAESSALPRIESQQSPPTEALVDQQIAHLQQSLRWKPDDAELQLQMANAYLLQTRLAILEELENSLRDAQQIDDIPPETRAALWPRTKMSVLHARVWDLLRAGHLHELDSLRSAPALRTCLMAAYQHLLLSRRYCPLLPRTHLRLAEVGFVGNSPDWDQRDVDRARWLAPADSRVQFSCGLLDLHAGRIDAAAASWKRALTLNRTHLRSIMAAAPSRMTYTARQFVERVLPDDPLYLIELGQRYRPRGDEAAGLVRALGQRATELIAERAASDWERAYVLGYGADFSGADGAIEHLSRAVDLRPDDVRTRLDLTELLMAEGRFDEALSHARQLEMFSSDDPRFVALQERIIDARREHRFGDR